MPIKPTANYVNLHIIQIAGMLCKPEMIEEIKGKIQAKMNLTTTRLTRILGNTADVSVGELEAIAEVLNEYRPTTWVDLVKPCSHKETPSQPKSHV